MNLLVSLIEQFEDQHYLLHAATPHEVLAELLHDVLQNSPFDE
jgi:hypothetical protein